MPLEPIVASLPHLWTTCDSLSMWTAGFGTGPGAGKCWLQFRHFHPHYDAGVAVPEHTPLDAELLGDGGSLLHGHVNRYCTDVERPATFQPTGTAPWHSGLSLTLDDDACETSMAVWDIQVGPKRSRYVGR